VSDDKRVAAPDREQHMTDDKQVPLHQAEVDRQKPFDAKPATPAPEGSERTQDAPKPEEDRPHEVPPPRGEDHPRPAAFPDDAAAVQQGDEDSDFSAGLPYTGNVGSDEDARKQRVKSENKAEKKRLAHLADLASDGVGTPDAPVKPVDKPLPSPLPPKPDVKPVDGTDDAKHLRPEPAVNDGRGDVKHPTSEPLVKLLGRVDNKPDPEVKR